MIFFILLSIFCEDVELTDFLNKDIKIFFAGYPTTFLGRDNDGSELIAHNKYVNFEKLNFNPKARIIKEGRTFEIFFSGARMCKNGNIIARCSTSGNWTIDRKYFGYSISKDGQCVTKDIDNTVKMKKCVDTDDQIFAFKHVTPDCNPENKFGDQHNVHVNLIQDDVKRYSIQTKKQATGEKNLQKDKNINIKDEFKLEEIAGTFLMDE